MPDRKVVWRRETNHARTCFLRGRRDETWRWWLDSDRPVEWCRYRGVLRQWLRLRCNDPNCPATILVRADHILTVEALHDLP